MATGMDGNTGYYSMMAAKRHKKTQKIFVLALLICLGMWVFIPGPLTADTEKEKQKQSQSSETRESEKKSKSESQSQAKQDRQDTSEDENKKYKGEPGTFIFHEADIRNVLLFFARTYKLNMVLEPGISGKVTCRLVNVPWDQALDLILRQHGLALVSEGKVLKPRKLDK